MDVIYKYSDFKITVEHKPNAKAVKLLHETLWGTNGPIFQHLDTEEKAKYLEGALAFTLEKNDIAIGTCTVLDREIILQGKKYRSWYGRYFAIDKQYQGNIYANLLLKQIKIYMEKFDDLPTIFYAYVEPANLRSSKLLKYSGFKAIRNFETIVFSRMYPKKDIRMIKPRGIDGNTIVKLLEEQYKDNMFVNFDNLFYRDNYFLIKINNEIVAGLQASLVKWKVNQLPGLSGKIIVRVLPHIPVVSKLFNPKDFRFAAFEGVYCKKGYEKELFQLMESACAELNVCLGMLWMDSECKVIGKYKDAGNWGIMNKIRSTLPVNVIAGFRDVTEEEQKQFFEKPTYISAFDLT